MEAYGDNVLGRLDVCVTTELVGEILVSQFKTFDLGLQRLAVRERLTCEIEALDLGLDAAIPVLHVTHTLGSPAHCLPLLSKISRLKTHQFPYSSNIDRTENLVFDTSLCIQNARVLSVKQLHRAECGPFYK